MSDCLSPKSKFATTSIQLQGPCLVPALKK